MRLSSVSSLTLTTREAGADHATRIRVLVDESLGPPASNGVPGLGSFTLMYGLYRAMHVYLN